MGVIKKTSQLQRNAFLKSSLNRFFSKRFIKPGVIGIAFLLITHMYFMNLTTHPFHADEYMFTRKSYFFDLFFINRDVQDPRWYDGNIDNPDQPKIGPYLYGLTLHLNGIDNIDQKFNETRFNDEGDGRAWWILLWNQPLENLKESLIPKLELIWMTRRTAVTFSLATFLIVFFICKQVKGYLFAFLATLILSLNPLMYSFGRRAMTDSMQLFAMYATLFLSLQILKKFNTSKTLKLVPQSLLLGLSIAFGVGVKISAIVLLIFLASFFAGLSKVLHLQKQSFNPLIQSFAIVLIVFFSLFVILHPYLYHNPAGNFISMFTNRLDSAKQYWQDNPSYAIYTRSEAIKLIIRQTLSPTHGPFVNFRLGPLPVDLVLFISGLWYLFESTLVRYQKSKQIAGEALLLLWTIVVFLSLVFYLKNNWPRYYLPMVSVIAITQAYAIAEFSTALVDKMLQKRSSRKSRKSAIGS